MQTTVKLWEMTGDESDEANQILSGDLLDSAGLAENAERFAQDVRDNRRRIFDGLIKETGGGGEEGVPFESLRLGRFIEQDSDNPAVERVITSFIISMVDKFAEENPTALQTIKADSAFQTRREYFGNDVRDYICEGVAQMLGFPPA